jgi:integrase/recombinase XerD
MRSQNIVSVLEGKASNAQKNWIKALRHLIRFGILQGECSQDVTANIKPVRGEKSIGHMTWKPPQIEQYRAHHPVGTIARLALELMLNIAARREDAHKIGRPHLSFNAEHQINILTWRPQKTARTTGKVLSIPVLPFLQEALDAMPRSDVLTFLTNDYGRPFASAAAFGNKFADWCDGLQVGFVRRRQEQKLSRTWTAQSGVVHAMEIGRHASSVAGARRARQPRRTPEVHPRNRTG